MTELFLSTPLPAPPPVSIELKRVTENSSNRSSNSSGYGQLLGTFLDQNSDEDDVYSKPSEPKEYRSLGQPNSLSNANSEPSLSTPPPIPNRQRARILQSASCPRNNEYIFMPPNRVRELCGDKRNGKFNSLHSSLDDSFNSSGNNSFYTTNGSPGPVSLALNGNDVICVPDGPPLPPRLERRSLEIDCTDAPPPILPKRQPRRVRPVNSSRLKLRTDDGGVLILLFLFPRT